MFREFSAYVVGVFGVTILGFFGLKYVMSSFDAYQFANAIGYLPKGIEVLEIVETDGCGGWREGCQYVLYRLDAKTVQAVRRSGLSGLAVRSDHYSDARNPYREWRTTPVKVDGQSRIWSADEFRTVYALHAGGSCGKSLQLPNDLKTFRPETSLARPGNFFTLTANEEGMVLIDAAAGVALFIYFG